MNKTGKLERKRPGVAGSFEPSIERIAEPNERAKLSRVAIGFASRFYGKPATERKAVRWRVGTRREAFVDEIRQAR